MKPTLFSNCCHTKDEVATPYNDEQGSFSEYGICPECKEHCLFLTVDELKRQLLKERQEWQESADEARAEAWQMDGLYDDEAGESRHYANNVDDTIEDIDEQIAELEEQPDESESEDCNFVELLNEVMQ